MKILETVTLNIILYILVLFCARLNFNSFRDVNLRTMYIYI